MTVLTGAPLLPTYARFPVTFVDGEGSWLIDEDDASQIAMVAREAAVNAVKLAEPVGRPVPTAPMSLFFAELA